MNKYFFLSLVCSNVFLLADGGASLHRYFWANYTQSAGNMKKAQHWYKKLLSCPHSVYSYKGYLTFLADTKQFPQILELMPQIEKKFIQDPEVQLIFVTALQETKQMKKADDLIISLSQTFKNNSEITLLAAQTYLRHQEAENALLTINAFLNNSPRRANNFIFYFLQSHIYLQLNQNPHALECVQKCLELHPHFDKGWLLCASLYEKEGKIEEALSGYSTFLELSGENSAIQQHTLSLMTKYKAVEDHKQHIISHSISLDNALLLFKRKQYSQALAHINAYLQKKPHHDEAKLLKIQILSAMKNFKQAANTLATWIIENKENELWPKTLHLLAYSGMPHFDVMQTFSIILDKHPDNMWCNLYYADLCMRSGKNSCAITCLEKVISYISDTTFAAKIAYQVALLHYENNDYQAMRTYLEKAHQFNEHCPHTNNTLAYYWATKGKDLTKAHQFISKALKAHSNNPYFLDTQALILYKEKKYTQAQEILEKLVTDNNNSTMLLHLAKVHYSLNNKEIADTFTKKAEALVKNNQEKKALEKMKVLLAQT